MNTEVNIPLLRKAVEWAEAEAAKPPELCEWNQADVRVTPDEFRSYFGRTQDKAPECGTCYCIAGFVAVTAVDPRFAESNMVDGVHSTDAAAIALGLPMSGFDAMSADCLFAGSNSIEDVRRIAESLAGERL